MLSVPMQISGIELNIDNTSKKCDLWTMKYFKFEDLNMVLYLLMKISLSVVDTVTYPFQQAVITLTIALILYLSFYVL